MFTKAFRALSSGSRDRDRFNEDPYHSRPASRRRAVDATHQSFSDSTAGGVIYASESDSDEYGIPQARKNSLGRHDTHRRAQSREQVTVEYKCPGCGELYKFKESDSWAPCKYCFVRPHDVRKRQNGRTQASAGSAFNRQIRSPRQLEDSFRNLYQRFGILLNDEITGHGTQQEVPSRVKGPSTEAATQLQNVVRNPSSKLDNPVPDESQTLAHNVLAHTNEIFGPLLRTPPNREPPPVPLPKSAHPTLFEANGSLRSSQSMYLPRKTAPFVPQQTPRSPTKKSGSTPQSNMRLSPLKRAPRSPHAVAAQTIAEPPGTLEMRSKQQLLEQFQSEFRSLFGNVDFLNADFCSTVRPKPSKRSLSEGSSCMAPPTNEGTVRPQLTRLDSEKYLLYKYDDINAASTPSTLEPLLLDSKALLAGHIHDLVSSLAESSVGASIERSGVNSQRSTYQSSPHVNWMELQAYYSILIRYTLDVEFCLTLVHGNTEKAGERAALKNDIVRFIACVLAACMEVIYESLTSAREDVTAPQAARYLLIFLVNPWLTNPLEPLASEYHKCESGGNYSPDALQSFSSLEEEARLLFLEISPSRKGGSSLRDEILSLILGRISNLPDTVQHAFAKWFAAVPSDTYLDFVETVKNYNLAQIKRIPIQDQRKTEEVKRAHDRRRLNGILGGPSMSQFDTDAEIMPWYSKRKSAWRLRSSCQTLQLLVVANDLRGDLAARLHGPNKETRQIHAPCRLFHADAFYTSLLDPEAGRFEVATDFDLWDSRRAQFTLCQFPFLLTLGTKVKILEYDNERKKKDAVRAEWHNSKGMSADPYWQLPVRRDHLIEDSFKVIREARGSLSGQTSKKLRVRFAGEEAVDAGGPQKEWFLILTQELFNPDLGLFYLSDSGHFWFHSACNKPNEYYELVGAVFGLAIYNQTPLFAPFPPFLFKKLAAAAPKIHGVGATWRHMWRPTLHDYAELSPDFARILTQGLVDPQTMRGMNFEIPIWQNGQSVYHPLVPNGADREITSLNIEEFVERAVCWALRDSVKNQFNAFARGFHSICGGNALSLFRGEELELLVRGSEDFDVDTLRAAVIYDNWSDPNSGDTKKLQSEDDVKRYYPVVQFFWDFFEEAGIEKRRRILRFITGTDRLPPAGIVNLVIKISRQPMKTGEFRYPSARTCFNQILLPDCFKKQAVFNKVFTNALDMAGTGFGMK